MLQQLGIANTTLMMDTLLTFVSSTATFSWAALKLFLTEDTSNWSSSFLSDNCSNSELLEFSSSLILNDLVCIEIKYMLGWTSWQTKQANVNGLYHSPL